jgi:hypothetical protein
LHHATSDGHKDIVMALLEGVPTSTRRKQRVRRRCI